MVGREFGEIPFLIDGDNHGRTSFQIRGRSRCADIAVIGTSAELVRHLLCWWQQQLSLAERLGDKRVVNISPHSDQCAGAAAIRAVSTYAEV